MKELRGLTDCFVGEALDLVLVEQATAHLASSFANRSQNRSCEAFECQTIPAEDVFAWRAKRAD